MNVHRASRKVFSAEIPGIAKHFHLAALHTFLLATVAGCTIMAGITPAEDRPAPHLPAQPRIGITTDLDRPAAHEVPAVHADIPFDHDTAGIHVLPDTLDPPSAPAPKPVVQEKQEEGRDGC